MKTDRYVGKLSVVVRNLVAASTIALGTGIVDARADVLVDTYNPGTTVDSFPIGLTYNFSRAVQFSTTTSITIDSVLAAISYSAGTPTISVGVMSQGSNGLPTDSFLYKAVLDKPVANISLSGLNWALDAGTYWLAAIPDPGFQGSWAAAFNPVKPALNAATAIDFNLPRHWSASSISTAIQITTAVPEPETYAMMLAGLAMLGFVARRRTSQTYPR